MLSCMQSSLVYLKMPLPFRIVQDIVSSFRTSNAAARLPTGIEMSVQVLTTGYWPKHKPVDINIPQILNDMQEIFKEFYLFKHSGRRLVWQHTLGTCVLKANFPKGKKELSVSLFQAVSSLLDLCHFHVLTFFLVYFGQADSFTTV